MEGSNNGPVLIQPQTVGDCNWREACVTRRVILRSFEGESDGKSFIHNRKEISLIQNHYNYQAAVPNGLSIQRVVQGGSLARFTNRKNSESRITAVKISFSRITKINK